MSRDPGSAADLSPVKRALLEIRELRARLLESETRFRQPIAIVGMGLRFPGGATDPASYWRLLHEGRDAIVEIPKDRWDIDAYYDPDPEVPGRMYARHGGFLERADTFDPHVFGISPREAEVMDPQQRLFLEVAWEALENAGQAPDRLSESATGVYLGIAGSDYSRLVFADVRNVDVYAASGTAFSVAAGRLSYILGLQGPSLAVDTACSSSLVTIHLAIQALRAGECQLALAGGVNLMLLPEIHVNFCRARMLAPDGRCKTFDRGADGYVRGEGAGVVVLKRLADAVANGDRVLAVIRGSAVNQDGRSSGLTAPNGPSQEAVIRAALGNAGLRPSDVDYVEAHGTGTSLGDPIEVRALGAVLGAGRTPKRPLLVGSVKTNIGHLEAAAGVAGLIKVVLALQQEEIPPHLHLQNLNPHLDWSSLPLRVTTERTPWVRGDRPRIAGVSSFGFSGTNAHLVLEEAPLSPALPAGGADRSQHVIAVSARTQTALTTAALRLADHLAAHPEERLVDVAFSANTGRAQLPHRLAVVAGDRASARAALESAAAGQESPALWTGVAAPRAPDVAFLFTGSGAQYVGMGRQLFDSEPGFRRTLLQCEEILRDSLAQPLISVIYPAPGAATPLDEASYTQPALFALEYALADLWRSWGIVPAAVLGHSTGELVAACVAGVYSLEDGLRLIAERGRLMQSLPVAGGMAAIFTDEASVTAAMARIGGALWLAAVNAADNVVVSGSDAPLQLLVAEFESRGVKSKRLAISNAFHSPLVEPMLDALEQAASRVTHHDRQVDLVSNVTGAVVASGELGPGYWRRHVRQAVRFADSVRTLSDQGYRYFLEIGPHPTLLGMAQGTLGPSALCFPSLRRDAEDWRVLSESLAALYVRGARTDWSGYDRAYPRSKLSLPTYPFERERYWIDSRPAAIAGGATASEAATEAAQVQSLQGPLGFAIGTFPAKWALLERLTTAYEIAALRALGAFTRKGERVTAEALRQRLNIGETYRHLLLRWLSKLAGEGYLRAVGDEFVAERALSDPSLPGLLAEAERVFADYPELLSYVRRCGDRLPEILCGRLSPLETLFPGGSFAEAEAIYQHSTVARYLNGVVRAAVGAAVDGRPGRVALLEIGAGTGGTSASVLPALPAQRATYVYTDMSDVFLAHAQQKFGAYGFLRYGRLDIERDPLEQGYAASSFDVVVAANVLHATRDLRRTLDHVRALLTPGGVLVLSETTTHPHYFDITTGLVEGWQSFDDDLRGDHPLIDAPRWETLLRERGFAQARAFPEPGVPTEILGNHVIVAALAEGAGRRDAELAKGAVTASAAPAGPSQEQATREELRAQLAAALPVERREMLAELARDEVMRVLRLDRQHPPDLGDRLLDLGLDSLMAVQFRNRLAQALGGEKALSSTLVFDHPTCEAIGAYLDRELFGAGALAATEAALAPMASVESTAALAAHDVEQMSDEETEALLLKRLESLSGRTS